MKSFQFHTKKELRQELESLNDRIWAAREFKYNLSPARKRAMKAEKSHLQFLIRTRRR